MNARVQEFSAAYNSQSCYVRTASNGGLGRDRCGMRCHSTRKYLAEVFRVKFSAIPIGRGKSLVCRGSVGREQEKAGAEGTGISVKKRMQHSDMDGVGEKAQENLQAVDQAIGSVDGLVDDAVAWCGQHGLVYGASQPGKDYLLVHAPFALAPVPFPEKAFLDAKSVATAYNAMIDSVSQDGEYLTNVLRLAAQYDEFTKSLLDIHKDILDGTLPLLGQSPQLSLLISRSDYMLHAPTSAMLQVELNTIASSFGCLSSLVSKLHRYILGRAGVSEEDIDAQLPKNVSMEAIVDGLAAAVNEHGHKNKVMMMVVQPGEQNSFDQQWLQLNLWNRYKIKTLRRTLADVCSRAIVDPETGHLVIDGNTVSLAYFRAGYTPMDYPTEKEWEARRIIEQSSAAKCPTVAMQLAGSKKVQQDLARPGVLEKFSRTEEEAQMMRRSFAGLWSLDDIASDADASAAVQDAIQNPDLYVLKPQREGGGNNIYGKDLADRLSSGQGLSAFILMQRILPPPHTVTMIRNGEAQVTESLSELGVYGALLRRDENILLNHEAGHLVRTKASSSSEGGVAAGFAVLDSPRLI